MDPIKPQFNQTAQSAQPSLQWGKSRPGKREVTQDFQRALGLHANVMSLAQASLGQDSVHFGQKYSPPPLEGSSTPPAKKKTQRPSSAPVTGAPVTGDAATLNLTPTGSPQPTVDPSGQDPTTVKPTVVPDRQEGEIASDIAPNVLDSDGLSAENNAQPNPSPVVAKPKDGIVKQVFDNVKFATFIGLKYIAPMLLVLTPLSFLWFVGSVVGISLTDRIADDMYKGINHSNLFNVLKPIAQYQDKLQNFSKNLAGRPGATNISEVLDEETILALKKVPLLRNALKKNKLNAPMVRVALDIQGERNPLKIVFKAAKALISFHIENTFVKFLGRLAGFFAKRIPIIGPPIALALENAYGVKFGIDLLKTVSDMRKVNGST